MTPSYQCVPAVPPPPPPPPRQQFNQQHQPTMNNFRPQLNPTISTSGFGQHMMAQSNFSPSSLGQTPITPFSSLHYSQASSPMTLQTPISSTTAYNPLDWSRSGPVLMGNYLPHSTPISYRPMPLPTSTLHASGMEESLPPPPPPYSPPANADGQGFPIASRRAASASAANPSQTGNGPVRQDPAGAGQPRSMSLNRLGTHPAPPAAPHPPARRHHQATLANIPPTPTDWDENDEQPKGENPPASEQSSSSSRTAAPPPQSHPPQTQAPWPAQPLSVSPTLPTQAGTGVSTAAPTSPPPPVPPSASRNQSAGGLVRMGASRNPAGKASLRERRLHKGPDDEADIYHNHHHQQDAPMEARAGEMIPQKSSSLGAALPAAPHPPARQESVAPPVSPKKQQRAAELRLQNSSTRSEGPASPETAFVASPRSRSSQGYSSFSKASLGRFEEFLRIEEAAKTDADKIREFVRFMVKESQFRRNHYSEAYPSVENELPELMSGIWQPLPTPASTPTGPAGKQTAIIRPPASDEIQSTVLQAPAQPSPNEFIISPAVRQVPFFHPTLSPIPSVPMTTNVDEDESQRGRSTSRWWENASSTGARAAEIERSQREVKYMGIAPDAIERMQWEDNSASQPAVAAPRSAPNSPNLVTIDVSRLVTLPPPYPRHYPAMNNKHPELAQFRAVHRGLAEMGPIKDAVAAFEQERTASRDQRKAVAAHRMAQFRAEVRKRLDSGEFTYAQAAEAEQRFVQSEAEAHKSQLETDFDNFQSKVMKPLSSTITERINRATSSIEQLRSGILDTLQNPTPNRSLEQGDEQPETLEKLNLIKWFFEIREVLSREIYSLEVLYSSLYKEVVLAPLLAEKDTEQVANVEAFFREDSAKEKLRFERESLVRLEELLSIMDRSVTRGAEDQLNTFWDIAPGIVEVIQKIPTEKEQLAKLSVEIPQKEYLENPEYAHHPLQYLYTLIRHSRMSAYQFIESQTNLFCLLHEAKSMVVRGQAAVESVERANGGGQSRAEIDRAVRDGQMAEEEKLIAELKEKVQLVESQWMDGLGQPASVREGLVEEYLNETGGWDDSLKE